MFLFFFFNYLILVHLLLYPLVIFIGFIFVGKIIKWICACLAQISSTSTRDPVKPLAGSLLLCLAEFAVRCGPTHLLEEKDGEQTLLLMIFKVGSSLRYSM